MKTIILIDGQNLFYGLKDMKILENQVRWDLLFKSFLSTDDTLIRTYWFRPQKIQDKFYTAVNIRNQIAFRQFHISSYNYLTETTKYSANILKQIDDEAKKVEVWLKREKERFSNIEFNYDKISLEFGDIEFIKTGIVKVNPYHQEYVGEKGVDIALAVKMISLSVENKCEKIILVSGDYDYLGSAEIIGIKL